MNAIAGLATSICTRSYKGYSELFMDRAFEYAQESLASVDRIEDWMYTHVLLVWGWIRNGQITRVRDFE